MRVWPKQRYVPGAYKRECDLCGFDYLNTELRKRWDGHLVCSQCYDEKPREEQLKPLPRALSSPKDVKYDYSDTAPASPYSYASHDQSQTESLDSDGYTGGKSGSGTHS